MEDKDFEQAIDVILSKPYARMFIPAEEGGFFAEILEFRGCYAEGDTIEEAYRNLEEAARSWVAACLTDGHPIRPPSEAPESDTHCPRCGAKYLPKWKGQCANCTAVEMPSVTDEQARRRSALFLHNLRTEALKPYKPGGN